MDTEVYQANTKLKDLTLTDNDGNALDLTGAELYFTVSNPNVGEIFTKTIGDGITVTDAVNGEIEIKITASDNDVEYGKYKQELLLIDVGNNRYSNYVGEYEVLESITTEKGSV